MTRLAESVLEAASKLPEGAPVTAKMLLRFGSRAALEQVFSRLVRRGKLLRAGRGMYVVPAASRFGSRAPAAQKVVKELSLLRGETIVPSGASAANALGLTTQAPTRTVYLTSGRSRKITLGEQIIYLQHAPAWQLTLPASSKDLGWISSELPSQVLRSFILNRKC